jgi:hypothetical protein
MGGAANMFGGEEILDRAADSRGFTLIEQKQLRELTTEGTEGTEERVEFQIGTGEGVIG